MRSKDINIGSKGQWSFLFLTAQGIWATHFLFFNVNDVVVCLSYIRYSLSAVASKSILTFVHSFDFSVLTPIRMDILLKSSPFWGKAGIFYIIIQNNKRKKCFVRNKGFGEFAWVYLEHFWSKYCRGNVFDCKICFS